jgi:hypothetical protein
VQSSLTNEQSYTSDARSKTYLASQQDSGHFFKSTADKTLTRAARYKFTFAGGRICRSTASRIAQTIDIGFWPRDCDSTAGSLDLATFGGSMLPVISGAENAIS